MFNPMTPAEVTVAIGRTAAEAARRDGPRGAFERGQLLSAYSGCRHLAVELASFEPELRSFSISLADRIAAAAASLAEEELAEASAGRQALQAIAERLTEETSSSSVGAAVCELLDVLHDARSTALRALLSEARRAMRQLCDREVELLAAAIERKDDR